jgi:hypothetical protein
MVIINSTQDNTKRIKYTDTNDIISRLDLTDNLSYKHDIVSIRLENVPQNLRKVHILIGPIRVGSIYKFIPGQNLLEQLLYDKQDILPVSKCNNIKFVIDFCFENNLDDVSTQSESYWYQEEEITKHVLSEKDVEIYDENEDQIIKGKQVLGYTTETIRHLCYKIPQIIIETCENELDKLSNEKHYGLKIWQRHTFYKKIYSQADLVRYINNYELHMENGKDIIEEFQLLDLEGQLDGFLMNQINFARGTANLQYLF